MRRCARHRSRPFGVNKDISAGDDNATSFPRCPLFFFTDVDRWLACLNLFETRCALATRASHHRNQEQSKASTSAPAKRAIDQIKLLITTTTSVAMHVYYSRTGLYSVENNLRGGLTI